MPIARAELVDYPLPGGRAVIALEDDGEILFRFSTGHISEQGLRELTDLMQQEIDSGTWTQHWNDPGKPESPLN
jgi:hypothetical protein